jgi:hypothetical protein
MKKIFAQLFFLLLLPVWVNAQTVSFAPDEGKSRIDVLIDGKLFTSYRFEERIRRPVLLPIITSAGNFVTRGFPIETRNSEDIGHPHQVGCSFSFGDVNGIDFWNNSTFRTAKELEHMGTISHRKVLKQQGGKGKGELVAESVWITPNGKTILLETTKYIFKVEGKNRIIERETTLTANGENVTFGDNKEGMFAIHLARELQQPSTESEKITDEKGNISETKDSSQVMGEYVNSEGLKGDKIWGTIGKWASVSGKINNENITVAVFDSSKNLNYPSYMMVRGYGLLALNPFGKQSFDAKAGSRQFILLAGKSITFRHQLMIYSEKTPPAKIEKDFLKFNK